MNRTLKHLDKLQQSFIDTIYIQLKTFSQASELLEVDINHIRQLNKDLETDWRPITKVRDKWFSIKNSKCLIRVNSSFFFNISN